MKIDFGFNRHAGVLRRALCAILFIFSVLLLPAQNLIDEDFESLSYSTPLPAGWSNSDATVSASYRWSLYTAAAIGEAHSGYKCLSFNSYNAPLNTYCALKTPVVNLSEDYTLSFYYKNPAGGAMYVYLSTDGGQTYPYLLETLQQTQVWTEVKCALADFTGSSQARVIFYSVSNYGTDPVLARHYLDDVKVAPAATCAKPVNMVVSALGETSATIDWASDVEGDEPSRYLITVTKRADGTKVLNNQIITPASHSYTITGLESGESYTVLLKGDCTPSYRNVSEVSDPLTFTTQCPAKQLPYEETFDELTTRALPECWMFFPLSTGTLGASQAATYSGSGKSLALSLSAEESARFVLPKVDHAANDIEVEFSIYAPYTLPGQRIEYTVGLMADPSDVTSYEPIYSGTIAYLDREEWKNIIFTTTASAYGSTRDVSVAFQITSSEYEQLIYFDDIIVRTPSTCVRMANLALQSVDSSSVVLSWTGGSAARAYQAMLVDAEGNASLRAVSSTGLITGLTPNTTYTARLRAICAVGDTSRWSGSTVSFKTLCGVQRNPIMREGFESRAAYQYGLPDCWTLRYTSNPYGYQAMPVYTYRNSQVAHTGSNSLCLPYMNQGSKYVITLPMFTSPEAGKYSIRLYAYRSPSDASTNEYLKVYYNNTPDVDVSKCLGTIYQNCSMPPSMTSSQGGICEYEFIIPSQGLTYLMLEYTSGGYGDFYIDDVEIFESPTCRRPTVDLEVEQNQAIFTFDNANENQQYIFAYSLNGSAVQEQVVASPFTLTNLQYSTTYTLNARVAAYCGAGDTSEWVIINKVFTTECEAVAAFPYTEGFDRVTTGCWQNAVVNNVYNNKIWQISNSLFHSGSGAAYMPAQTEGNSNALVSPLITLPANNYRLSFAFYRNSTAAGSVGEGVRVLVNTTPAVEGATELGFVPRLYGLSPVEPAEGWYEYEFDIPMQGNVYILLVGESKGGDALCIDDIVIAEIPECDFVKFSQLAISAVTASTAALTLYKTDAVAAGWQVAYGPNISAPTDSAATIVTAQAGSGMIVLSGLEGETRYNVWVRYNCNGGSGIWSNAMWSFTTSCVVPMIDETHPFEESFENYDHGTTLDPQNSCYEQDDASGSNSLWQVRTTSNYNVVGYDYEPYDGTKAIYNSRDFNTFVVRQVYLYAGKNYAMGVYAKADAAAVVQMSFGDVAASTAMTSILSAEAGRVEAGVAWTHYESYFNVARDGYYYIAVGVKHTTTNGYTVILDKWTVDVRSCVPPTLANVSGVTAQTANINIISSASQWETIVSANPIDASTIPATGGSFVYRDTTTTPFVTITGLTANTTYYYTVRTACDDATRSAWIKPQSFHTLCDAIALPYEEDFEQPRALDCWTFLGDGYAGVSAAASYSGTCSFAISNAFAITPMLNTASLSQYEITGKVYTEATNATFAIGVTTDPSDVSATEILQEFANVRRGQWQDFTSYFFLLDDPDYADFASAQQITIAVSGNTSDVFYFDDIKVQPVDACPHPVAITYSNLTHNSVQVQWTEAGTASLWRMQVVERATNRIVFDTLTITTTHTVMGLNQYAEYQARVASICAVGDTSIYAEGAIVRTPCLETVPYAEGFEDVTPANVKDRCFAVVLAGSPDYYAPATTSSMYTNSGNTSLLIPATAYSHSLLVLPRFDRAVSELRLSFYYREPSEYEGYPQPTVGVVADPSAPETFVPLMSYARSGAFTYAEYSFRSLPAQYDNYYIAIKADGTLGETTKYLYIDDVKVELAPECDQPQNITYTLNSDNITVALTAQTNDIQYALLEHDATLDDAQIVSVVGPSFTINGLKSHTQYTLYLRTNCGNSQSAWTAGYTFVTACLGALNLPYYEDFEVQGALNEVTCLTSYNDGGKFEISDHSPYQAESSTSSLSLETSRLANRYLILPEFNANLSDMVLVFYYACAYQGPQLTVGYNTNIADPTYGTTDVARFTASRNVQKAVVRFADYNISAANQNARIIICAPADYMYTIVIDNISVLDATDCESVQRVTVDAVNTTSATLSWTQTLAERYEVELSAGSTVVENVTVQGEQRAFTGLAPNTLYTARVRSVCTNGTSDWTSCTFTTLTEFAEIPYTTTFDDAEAANWKFENKGAANYWMLGAIDGSNALYITNDGSSFAYTPNVESTVFATRRLRIFDGQYKVSFRWKGLCATDDYARVMIVPADATIQAGTPILTDRINSAPGVAAIDGGALSNAATWTTVETRIDALPAATNDYMIVVQWTNNNANGGASSFAIDDFQIVEETCTPSLSIAVAQTSITLYASDYYAVEYKLSLDENGNNLVAPAQTSTSDTITIASLAAATQYYLHYRVYCAEDVASVWVKESVLTMSPLLNAPFATNFESSATDAIWVFNNDLTNKFIIGAATEAQNGGSRSLYISDDESTYNYDGDSESYSYAALPINLPQGTYRISYDWQVQGETSQGTIYDYARAALIPYADLASIQGGWGVAGLSSTSLPDGWISLEPAEQPLAANPRWRTATTEVSSDKGASYAILFAWINDEYVSGEPPLAIDNIAIKRVLCPDPIVNVATTDDAFVVTVENPTPGTSIFTALDTVRTAPTTAFTEYAQARFTITYSGVNAGRTYYFYCVAACSGDTIITPISIPYVPTLPYTCSFDSDDDLIGWEMPQSTTNHFTIGSGVAYSGARSLYLTNDGSTYAYDRSHYTNTYASRLIALPAGQVHISYTWKCYGGTFYNWGSEMREPGDYGLIGLLSENSNVQLVANENNSTPSYVSNYRFSSDFIWLYDRVVMQNNDQWRTHSVEINVPTAGNYYLVVGWRNQLYCDDAYSPIAIDDIHVWTDNCQKPMVAVKSLNIDPNDANARSVDVEITTLNEADIYYALTTSATPPADTLFTLAAATKKVNFTQGALTPGTKIYVHAFALCSQTERSATATLEFDIVSETFETFPFSTDFSNDADNARWTIANGLGPNHLYFGNAAEAVLTGTKSLYLANASDAYTYVKPLVDNDDLYAYRIFSATAGSSYDIEFDWKFQGNPYYDYARIFIMPYDYAVTGGRYYFYDAKKGRYGMWGMTSVPTDAVALDGGSPLVGASEWTHYQGSFTVPESGLYKLVVALEIYGISVNNPSFALDNISVANFSLAKSNISVSNITETAATIRWTTPDADYKYKVRVTQGATVILDAVYDADTDSVRLENLTPATGYTASVQTFSADFASYGRISSLNFATSCGVIELPYLNDFSSYDAGTTPVCFTSVATGTGADDWKINSDALRAQFKPGVASHYTLTTPQFVVPATGDYCLRFDYNLYDILQNDYLKVHLNVDSSSTLVYEVHDATNANRTARISLANYRGENITITFDVYSVNGGTGYAEIDNLMLVATSGDEIYHETICYEENYAAHGFNVAANDLNEGENVLLRVNTITTKDDVDTAVTVYLTRYPLYQTVIYDTICEGSIYNQNGFIGLHRAGRYTNLLRSATGCDSTIVLYLNVTPRYTVKEARICEGDTYLFGSQLLSVEGVYTDTAVNARGCDSITVLTLLVVQAHYYETVAYCGSSYEWEGMTITDPGDYVKTYTSTNGCDSTRHLSLTFLEAEYPISATICEGGVYYFDDRQLTEAGTYTKIYNRPNADCDSIVVLTLTVTPAPVREIDDYVCYGESFEAYGFNVQDITSDTLLSRTVKTLDGCDSTVLINIAVHPVYDIDTTVYIQPGEYYNFGGNSYTNEGDYSYTYKTADYWCDSTVTLHLRFATAVGEVYAMPLIVAPSPIRAGTTSYVVHEWTAEEATDMKVTVLTTAGQVVKRFAPRSFPIAVNELHTAGLYYIVVETGTGAKYVGKLIVK